MIKIIQTIILFQLAITVYSECIWSKVCYDNKYNCPAISDEDKRGFPLEDEQSQKTLLKRCPEIFTNCNYFFLIDSLSSIGIPDYT